MVAQTLNEEVIFKVASRIANAEARTTYLEHVCDDNSLLRTRVDTLLTAFFREPDFLEPSDQLASGMPELSIGHASEHHVGMQIGSYVLREQLAEGGMGVVYIAEQTEPIRRDVALKIIKPGMTTKDVVTRFQLERQALALMDHPNIARVLDAGTTDGDAPYFVMELVRGLPITRYCDEHCLTIADRLKLFGDVCRAVEHAHQKGVIHRDIKPSNVLVTEVDGNAVPKVIDFGVARAVNDSGGNATVYTQVSQLIGTPRYMSPEQAGMGVVDIDTRSDVYSLGVLLYEMLTGTTPFDSEALQVAAFDEMRRIIREEEPTRPSTQVSGLAVEDLSIVAKQRKSDPRKLSTALSRELDWLVMKSLEKDRERRYQSAGALAEDVERYLAGEPVQACPPSRTYLFRKFAARHKAVLTTTTFVLVALVLGIVGTSYQAWRASCALAESDANLEAARRAAYIKRVLWHTSPSLTGDEIAVYTRLIDRDPNEGDYWHWRAEAHAAAGDHVQAINDFSKRIELEPETLGPRVSRAIEEEQLGRWRMALTDWEDSLPRVESAGERAFVLNHMAWLLTTCPEEEFRDIPRAVKLAREASTLVPGAATIWMTLGVALFRNGEPDAAVEALDHSEQLSNANELAVFSLLYRQVPRNQNELVREIRQLARGDSPAHPVREKE